MDWGWAVGAAVALWTMALAFAATVYLVSGQGLVVAVLFFGGVGCFVASAVARLMVARHNRKQKAAKREQP